MTRALTGPPLSSLSSLLFEVPSFPGKLRLVDTLGRFTSRLGSGRATFSPLPGAHLAVDLHDRIERQMWGGCFETHVRKCFEALLREEDVFLDIGAHIGYHTVIGACLVGAAGMVVAFEPDPILHERLVRNTEQLPWVRAFPCAVWESSGPLSFERSSERGESGWGALTVVRDLGKGQHISVKGVSLDDWCQEFPLDRARAIKIDAEGSETGILKGARNFIRRFRPAIVLEMNEIVLRQAGSSSAALAEQLLGLDYKLYGLSWPRLARLDEGKNPVTSEVLGIPEEQVEAALGGLGGAGFQP